VNKSLIRQGCDKTMVQKRNANSFALLLAARSVTELPGQDSNLDKGNQNPLCYHLHHRAGQGLQSSEVCRNSKRSRESEKARTLPKFRFDLTGKLGQAIICASSDCWTVATTEALPDKGHCGRLRQS
jgi:hypothetical protein